MKKILLVLSAACHLEKPIERALENAKSEEASLAILFVVDQKAADSITTLLTNSGFIGEKPSDELRSTLMQEYRQRARKHVEDTAELARQKGIETSTYIREGELEKECLGLIKELGIDLLVVPRCGRTPISELVTGSACDRLKINAPCDVLMVDEG